MRNNSANNLWKQARTLAGRAAKFGGMTLIGGSLVLGGLVAKEICAPSAANAQSYYDYRYAQPQPRPNRYNRRDTEDRSARGVIMGCKSGAGNACGEWRRQHNGNGYGKKVFRRNWYGHSQGWERPPRGYDY